jgi:signal transduction histidine kinase
MWLAAVDRWLRWGWRLKALHFVGSRLHNPVFWRVHLLIGLLTVAYYAMEAVEHGSLFEHLHYTIPVFYAFPIVKSWVYFGRVGTIFTTCLIALLVLPNIVFFAHHDGGEWLTELLQLSTGLTVGIVFAQLLGQETAERRLAQEKSAHLAMLHQQIAQAQEEERRRIARDLHDTVAQSLVVLSRRLDTVAATPRLSPAIVRSLQELRETADEILVEVRRFSRELRPSVLDDLGLAAALEWLAAEFTKRSGTQTHVDVQTVLRRLRPEVELPLFRIVQEALFNVEKHAGASEVEISLACAGGMISLMVRDNGNGFRQPVAANGVVPCGKLGLAGMRERAMLIGGRLDIKTEIGKGTCIAVTLKC